jgi:hypothetical protein
MYICVHTHTAPPPQVYVQTCVHMYVHVCTSCARSHAHVCACLSLVSEHDNVCAYVHVHIYVHVHSHAVCTHMCAHCTCAQSHVYTIYQHQCQWSTFKNCVCTRAHTVQSRWPEPRHQIDPACRHGGTVTDSGSD